MSFRNPLTSLPAAGIIGPIQGSQLAADAIDGMVITGALIRTAAPPATRWEFDSPAGDEIRGYTGSVDEDYPGIVQVLYDTFTGNGATLIASPQMVALMSAYAEFSCDLAGLTNALIHADTITFEATHVLDPTDVVGLVSFPANTIVAGGSRSIVVNFSPVFASAPTVLVSLANAPGGSAYLVPRVLNVTASSFSVYIYNVGTVSAVYASSVLVGWRAVNRS